MIDILSERAKLMIICGLCAMFAPAHSFDVSAQTVYQYKTDDATICFFDRNQSQYITQKGSMATRTNDGRKIR